VTSSLMAKRQLGPITHPEREADSPSRSFLRTDACFTRASNIAVIGVVVMDEG
jgi:hypothetical protein